MYPKAKATEIARAVLEPVLSMPAAEPEEAEVPEAPEIVSELLQVPVLSVLPSAEEKEAPEPPEPETEVICEAPQLHEWILISLV